MRKSLHVAMVLAALAGIAAKGDLPRREPNTDKQQSSRRDEERKAAAEAKRARKAAKRAAERKGEGSEG